MRCYLSAHHSAHCLPLCNCSNFSSFKLKRLAGGDLAGVAEQLVPAFTTTVTGLAVCALCFWFAGVRGRWYEEDLRQLERQVEEHTGG